MIRISALLSVFLACASGGCAAVTVVGAVGSAGFSAVSTAGGLAVSGAGATLSGASAVARATAPSPRRSDYQDPSYEDRPPED